LSKIALDLLANGPLKSEITSRRVRSIFDHVWIFDTTEARHVWEHPYYPQYYVPSQVIIPGLLSKNDPIDNDGSAFFATLKGSTKSTDRVLVFEKGALEGLVRFEFSAMDSWYEEDQPIYQHPKDPYKRIDILPSTRKITVKANDVVVAESTLNMFLFETMLRTRFYMPKTAIEWEYTSESSTTSFCPYKGKAEYYNLNVNGKEIKDAIWWYRYPTAESAPIAGMACFYNEKVDVYIDGVKEEK
ncbi:MAG: hypothetical protein Q9214_003171, partial [Letrouitia sp. 1 TL-2023]